MIFVRRRRRHRVARGDGGENPVTKGENPMCDHVYGTVEAIQLNDKATEECRQRRCRLYNELREELERRGVNACAENPAVFRCMDVAVTWYGGTRFEFEWVPCLEKYERHVAAEIAEQKKRHANDEDIPY